MRIPYGILFLFMEQLQGIFMVKTYCAECANTLVNLYIVVILKRVYPYNCTFSTYREYPRQSPLKHIPEPTEMACALSIGFHGIIALVGLLFHVPIDKRTFSAILSSCRKQLKRINPFKIAFRQTKLYSGKPHRPTGKRTLFCLCNLKG